MSPVSLEAARSHDEAARLAALRELAILDTAPESMFDEAARVAAAICGTPVAVVNLLDAERQWFKAKVGTTVSEFPRQDAFCNHTIGQTAPLVIVDAAGDDRFRTNPFVTGEMSVRFYAGMPLNTTGGHTLGTLCVFDSVPRTLTREQTEALAALGRQVVAQIELRAKMRLLTEVLAAKDQVEHALRERTLLFGAFMDHSPTIGFIKDQEGRFLYYNQVFCERFGVSATEWIGKSVFDLFPREFAESYHATDMAVLDTGVAQIVEETSPGSQKTVLHWRTHKFRISDGSAPGLLGGVSLDISDEREAALEMERSHAKLKAANLQLTELSITDGLTGLRNRRSFDERLSLEMDGELPLSLILLDIDHFKKINDSYGHSFGDEVLRIVARVLEQNSRTPDEIARFGGEEFAVLLPRVGMRQALVVADRLRAAVADFAWKRCPVTLSAGVAVRTVVEEGETELIQEADSALYRAKSRGRNRVEALGRESQPAETSQG